MCPGAWILGPGGLDALNILGESEGVGNKFSLHPGALGALNTLVESGAWGLGPVGF
jgi:hypothetical protein